MTAQEPTAKAHTVFEHARDSVEGFLDAFEVIRKAQGKTVGRTGHTDQDQLRAALVFAAAGLDSTLKELIRGTVRHLALFDTGVRKELETFVSRQLRGNGDDPETSFGSKFLARVLISDVPLDGVIEEYVLDLTGSSLQSADQVIKTLKALGVDPQKVIADVSELKSIFSIRNQIIHELDVNLRAQRGQRNRNDRGIVEMKAYANTLLDVAHMTLEAIEAKLAAAT